MLPTSWRIRSRENRVEGIDSESPASPPSGSAIARPMATIPLSVRPSLIAKPLLRTRDSRCLNEAGASAQVAKDATSYHLNFQFRGSSLFRSEILGILGTFTPKTLQSVSNRLIYCLIPSAKRFLISLFGPLAGARWRCSSTRAMIQVTLLAINASGSRPACANSTICSS
jgi:hypothetical protein